MDVDAPKKPFVEDSETRLSTPDKKSPKKRSVDSTSTTLTTSTTTTTATSTLGRSRKKKTAPLPPVQITPIVQKESENPAKLSNPEKPGKSSNIQKESEKTKSKKQKRTGDLSKEFLAFKVKVELF
jgi:hypothetical protein